MVPDSQGTKQTEYSGCSTQRNQNCTQYETYLPHLCSWKDTQGCAVSKSKILDVSGRNILVLTRYKWSLQISNTKLEISPEQPLGCSVGQMSLDLLLTRDKGEGYLDSLMGSLTGKGKIRVTVILKSGARWVFSSGPWVQFSPGLRCVRGSLVYRDHEEGHCDFFLTKPNPPGV